MNGWWLNHRPSIDGSTSWLSHRHRPSASSYIRQIKTPVCLLHFVHTRMVAITECFVSYFIRSCRSTYSHLISLWYPAFSTNIGVAGHTVIPEFGHPIAIWTRQIFVTENLKISFYDSSSVWRWLNAASRWVWYRRITCQLAVGHRPIFIYLGLYLFAHG